MTLSWRFLSQARAAPLLSAEEERDLALRSSAGDAQAAERLMTSHFRFVVSLARRYRGAGISFADLVQAGMVGLNHAVRKFDPATHDNRFATYAMWWVRAAMQEHVVRSWSLVRVGTTNAQKALFLAVRKALADGSHTLSDEWAQRLAGRFATTMAEVKALAARVKGRDLALDVTDDADGTSWVARIPDPAPSPEEIAIARCDGRSRARALAGALAGLDPRERLIIMRRHLSELAPSLEVLAREMQLSKERVRVLEKKALAKLKSMLAPHAGDA